MAPPNQKAELPSSEQLRQPQQTDALPERVLLGRYVSLLSCAGGFLLRNIFTPVVILGQPTPYPKTILQNALTTPVVVVRSATIPWRPKAHPLPRDKPTTPGIRYGHLFRLPSIPMLCIYSKLKLSSVICVLEHFYFIHTSNITVRFAVAQGWFAGSKRTQCDGGFETPGR